MDKSKINPAASYMLRGGNQIIEIMEKEFSFDYIKNNADKFKISHEFDSFELWINCNTNLNQTKKLCKELSEKKGYQYYRFGICEIKKIKNALYCKVNVVPTLNDQGDIVDKYSFLDYEVINIVDTNYKVLFSRINRKHFGEFVVADYLKKKLEKVIVMQRTDNGWVEVNDKWAREYKQSLKVMEKLAQ